MTLQAVIWLRSKQRVIGGSAVLSPITQETGNCDNYAWRLRVPCVHRMLSAHSCRVPSPAVLVCNNSASRARGSILSRSLSGPAIVLEDGGRQKPYLYICMYLDVSKPYRKKKKKRNQNTYPFAVAALKVIYKFIPDDTLAEIV